MPLIEKTRFWIYFSNFLDKLSKKKKKPIKNPWTFNMKFLRPFIYLINISNRDPRFWSTSESYKCLIFAYGQRYLLAKYVL